MGIFNNRLKSRGSDAGLLAVLGILAVLGVAGTVLAGIGLHLAVGTLLVKLASWALTKVFGLPLLSWGKSFVIATGLWAFRLLTGFVLGGFRVQCTT